MATSTNSKVFVSPGVYTSEVDLSYVAQSVGVTTLGMVGETLRGPAFEPIFIRNYDEFRTYFGGTSPEKFVNTQIPKYEASYIAKSYLQQSNQLFVTRVLGLSGYDAGPSWTITTKANVNPNTIDFNCVSATTIDCVEECVEYQTVDFLIPFTGCNNDINSIILDQTAIPAEILMKLTSQYEQFNGSTSSLSYDLKSQVFDVINAPSTEGNSISYYGAVPGTIYSGMTNLGFTASTNTYGVDSVDASVINFASPKNDPWYYSLFDNNGNSSYSGFSFFSVVDGLTLISASTTTTTTIPPTTTTTTTNPCAPTGTTTTTTTTTLKPTDCYTGNLIGTIFIYSGVAYTQYDDLVIATLRSRGNNVDGAGAVYEVSGLTDVSMVCSGQYSGVNKNPFAKFALNVKNIDGSNFTFETSFMNSDTQYLSKVFGTSNFGKDKKSVPLFVEENYPALLNYAYKKGYIRGLNCEITSLPEARNLDSSSIGWYLEQYQTPSSPWVVSELRGSKVYELFRFTTISDGAGANTEVKISITNISFNNDTFDVLVRDFFDTDESPVVLEKFTNCNMNPNDNGYIAKKIGTSDGEYQLNSKLIMVEVNENAPIDALPCGFDGYENRQYAESKPSFPIYKTKYDYPGEEIFNPPFGFTTGGDNKTISNGDNVRRTYLGISDKMGVDISMFGYKGKQAPLSPCDSTGDSWIYKTKGFHMDVNAASITIPNGYTTSGESAYYVGNAEFTSDPTNESNPYYRLYARKFTLLVSGGFDGWDIYRERRTNEDKYKIGRTGFLKGFNPTCSVKYPNATGWGAFKQITVGDNTQDWGNSDYYAYLLGYRTFANPEAVNINVFVSPGIDYVNNSDLVEEVVDMIENDRADSIYVTTTPDYNMLTPNAGTTELIYPQEAVDNLDNVGIDSNYTATYYPWILTKDTDNNTQIYLPPTGEVVKNIALTDNIAFPWFAAAGYTRGIVNSIKARKKLTQEDRDVLYNGRLNPIATFSDVGTVIWGNKTLQVKDSALNRMNVRRLLLQARKLISAVSVRLLFEQNDDKVRQDFLNAVNPILDSIRRDRGLYDFRVEVSSDAADLDRNQMTGKIWIKPTAALEFIDITFYITPSGASFDNI